MNRLVLAHLWTVLPAFVIGTYLLSTTKGTRMHRFFGRIYLVLMSITATITLFISAEMGPSLLGHFGFLHLLSVFTLYTIYVAIKSVRERRIDAHRSAMRGLYLGGILIAGAFALMPGRSVGDWLRQTLEMIRLSL